ncbi:hypothetical protein P148_SR1C00001G0412 [candidate division SR1 bacterium RAAC1_SR1_1]|nr:hypothetical protein P148_SR1C00001G0412 [candidate division SR1 bacterium RAAC1_SR1_1]
MYFLSGIQAQEIKDSLFQEILSMLENHISYTISGCVVDVDYQTKTPFIKKAGIDITEDFFIFLMSDPFADETFLMCRSIYIVDKRNNIEKEFVLKHPNTTLDRCLRESKLKIFTDEEGRLLACGITD